MLWLCGIKVITRCSLVFTSYMYLPEDDTQQSQEQEASNYGHHNPPQWHCLLAIRTPPNHTGVCLIQSTGLFLDSFHWRLGDKFVFTENMNIFSVYLVLYLCLSTRQDTWLDLGQHAYYLIVSSGHEDVVHIRALKKIKWIIHNSIFWFFFNH